MSELEDLNAKAARLWLEFMQAQAKAAASAAAGLPDVTRSLAEAGVPLAAEMHRWMQGALATTPDLAKEPPQAATDKTDSAPPAAVAAAPARKAGMAPPITRANHRRLKAPTSMSRRRARRA
jgi:hypothetical protein